MLLSKKNDAFTTHINNNLPSIKFTTEREENCKLPMLDIMIHRADDGKLKVTIFRKPIHTDQYLSMDSHHPLQHKLGVIRTLEHREQNTGHWPRGQSDRVANNKASPGILWIQTVTFSAFYKWIVIFIIHYNVCEIWIYLFSWWHSKDCPFYTILCASQYLGPSSTGSPVDSSHILSHKSHNI